MLGPGRYLLGVAEILLLGGFAWLGGAALRSWLLPRFEGAPAYLATSVLALALLIWAAEILGTFGAFHSVPYLLVVIAAGALLWKFVPRADGTSGYPHPVRKKGVRADYLLAPLLVASIASGFVAGVKTGLSTGMTGFDSTWYHGPFAAEFFQSGDTWSLHFIAPQFLAWFYPANAEIFHAMGMLGFDRDILSPLLNLGWFFGCLVACWCIGRPYKVETVSLVLGAVVLGAPLLADQAGEARNDIVGIFFLLAAVAIALNGEREGRAALVAGLAAGLAAGTKLNFLLPAAVLVLGLAAIAPRGARGRVFGLTTLAALAGGGYWYLRNLAHSGNPLPWLQHLGPIDLPAPEQALGGREAHSVLGYLGDGAVWSDWFLPGLKDGLWALWPLILGAAIVGLLLTQVPLLRRRGGDARASSRSAPSPEVLALAGLVGLATALAWFVAPTSASGPEGAPRGFESGLRYLAPALVLGFALLPAALTRVWSSYGAVDTQKLNDTFEWRGKWAIAAGAAALVLAIGVGYPVQRHYLDNRYKDPSFTAPGLNAAFAWARDVSDSRIATTSTRQYPLFGTDLSNEVDFIGTERPHGGFEAPSTCAEWRRLLNEGNYDYVIATRDREEPNQPPYPPSANWTEDARARVLLKEPPTVVFALKGKLDPSCE